MSKSVSSFEYQFRPLYSPPSRDQFESGGGELITEQTGYRSVGQQVQELMNAGEFLERERRRMYFDSDLVGFDEERTEPNPYGEPTFDPADWTKFKAILDAKAAAWNKLQEEAKNKPQDAENGPSDASPKQKASEVTPPRLKSR